MPVEIPLREFIEQRFDDLEKRLDERRDADHAALRLQADEYERRLVSLNHAHEKAIEVQHTYVTQDKYEDKLLAEQQAREIALERIDEKFEEYVKRYEARQREVDLLLTAQKAATDAAKHAAENEGRRIRDQTEEQGRKQSRNLVVVGLLLTLTIALINFGAPYVGG